MHAGASQTSGVVDATSFREFPAKRWAPPRSTFAFEGCRPRGFVSLEDMLARRAKEAAEAARREPLVRAQVSVAQLDKSVANLAAQVEMTERTLSIVRSKLAVEKVRLDDARGWLEKMQREIGA